MSDNKIPDPTPNAQKTEDEGWSSDPTTVERRDRERREGGAEAVEAEPEPPRDKK